MGNGDIVFRVAGPVNDALAAAGSGRGWLTGALTQADVAGVPEVAA